MSEHILKKYPTEELRAGMIVGKSVYDEQEQELVAEGAVLTNALILSILERPIFTVTIRADKAPAQPDAHVLDRGFVDRYGAMIQELGDLFALARQTKAVDLARFERIADECRLHFTDGLKAITQVHNILRKGDYLPYHSVNTAILAGILGGWIGFKQQDLRDLTLAGLLHDIGKTQVADEILDKPGKLTEDELYAAQRHATIGAEMLKGTALRGRGNILSGVLHHHERGDGSGYPEGLSNEQISPFAKILAIVDIYDAMAANKAYARKKSPFEIFAVLFEEMTKRLDARYCVLFIKNVRRAMNGNWVRLSTDERAKIVYIDESQIKALPMVQTQLGEFIDLNGNRNIHIVELISSDEL